MKGQKVKHGKQESMEVRKCKTVHGKTETGNQKGDGSGNEGAKAGDCEDERPRWSDREGGGWEVRRQCLDAKAGDCEDERSRWADRKEGG